MAKQEPVAHIHNGGCVTWAKLVPLLVCLTGLTLAGSVYMVSKQRETTTEIVKRIDQRLNLMQTDIVEIKKEVQSR